MGSGCGGLESGVPGLDDYGFSYHEVTETITIRFNQQMVVAGEVIIEAGEELRIEGQLVLIK